MGHEAADGHAAVLGRGAVVLGGHDCGDLAGARWLEAMVPLWVRAGAALGRWDHGPGFR